MTTPLPREHFPVADRYRYLNHARVAAPPTVVAHALARDASAATMLGSTSQLARTQRAEAVRRTCADLLGTSADDLTFVRNTTEGMALVANGLHWAPGDEVVVVDREHPLTVTPFAALADRGVRLRTVAPDDRTAAVPIERFAEALRAGQGRARLLVVAWVHHARGWRHDLAALAEVAHAHGALLVVDAIQGAGVVPLELAAWGVDAAAVGAQKWLLGPEGIGLLHTTPELRSTLRVQQTGYGSLALGDDGRYVLDLVADLSGRRFEGGTSAVGATGGLGASSELLAGAGIDAIWAHVDRWCDALVGGLGELGADVLSDRSPDGRSSIVSARFDRVDADALVDQLVAHGIVVSAWDGAVRFSPHGWNDEEDLDAALRALRRASRR